MCDNSHMATNLHIDEVLLTKAQQVSGAKTKRETVELALKGLIDRESQDRIKLFLEAGGQIDFDPDWDYKELRRQV